MTAGRAVDICDCHAIITGRVGPSPVYEEKVDGWRIVAHKDGRHGWLVSRTGRDHAARFPQIPDAIRQTANTRALAAGRST